MNVILIGGSGHIGTYLAPMLINAGHQVTSITRGASTPYEDDPAWKNVISVRMDRAKEPDFAIKIAALKPDIVVDLINFNIDDTKAMVKALSDSQCRQYLYCSSCWAHGSAEILPFDPDDIQKEPLDEYGKDKFASELYLKDQYRQNGFPATIIMPGQISGPGWTIMNPWANKTLLPFQKIANGEGIKLPNFGMETLHHVHGYDVARCFYQAIIHRDQALGESYHAVSGGSITLYGYAKLMYEFFGKDPKIGFLPWTEWCEYVGDTKECEDTYYHITRSGFYNTAKEETLLDYHPRFTNTETIKIAVQSYIDRGLITI